MTDRICEHPDCDKPVPKGFSKYCGKEHAKIMAKRKARAREDAKEKEVDPLQLPLATDKPAMRKCMSCGCEFESDGPWNRICGDCKSKHGQGRTVEYERPSHPTSCHENDDPLALLAL